MHAYVSCFAKPGIPGLRVGSLRRWAGTWPRGGRVGGDLRQMTAVAGTQRLGLMALVHVGLRPVDRGTTTQPRRALCLGELWRCQGKQAWSPRGSRNPLGECSEWQGASRARELTEQIMSGGVRAGSGSTGSRVEPAFPVRPASSAAVRIYRVVVGTLCHPRALGRGGETRAWCQPPGRVVWCPRTSASVCWDLKGPARI